MRIIANIGFNAFGRGITDTKERAIELIEVAAQSGAHAVVVPHFRADTIYKKDAPELEATRQYEMPFDWYFDFKQVALDAGLHFIVSPRYPDAVARFEQLNIREYHIQNGDIRVIPLLKAIRDSGKAVLLSTGYSSLDEVQTATALWTEDEIIEVIDESTGESDFVTVYKGKNANDLEMVILHSTGGLPTTPENAVLLRMLDLGSEFFPLYIGLESFYQEPLLDIMAMVLKPAAIMRRIDLSDKWGLESSYSLSPESFRNLARLANVMVSVNNPELLQGFTIDDADKRRRLMRCERDDYLLPPET